jgi:dUTP pyrophosphatase
MLEMKIKRIGEVFTPPPAYQTDGAAGLDLHAALTASLTLEPGQRELIPTGYAVALPEGHEGHVRPRSGLALNHGVTVLNTPGTIDGDYRGEIGVVLINHGAEPFVVEPGARIAQLIVSPVTRVSVTETDELDDTDRGHHGYGSTGV